MTREERLKQLFKALNEGKISEEAYDQALINMNDFEYEEDEVNYLNDEEKIK